jgi:hypothetical protein
VLLDATAKAAYQARLTDLEEALEEAEGFNDPARAAKARHERDFLVQELGQAVGLGGRDRRAAAHAERARLNAIRAIRAAMANWPAPTRRWGGIWPSRSGPAATVPTSRPTCPCRLGTPTPAVVPGAPGVNADPGECRTGGGG